LLFVAVCSTVVSSRINSTFVCVRH
jgi:hypothetical protein